LSFTGIDNRTNIREQFSTPIRPEAVGDLDPNIPQWYYNRGNARASLRDFQGAIPDFQKAAQLARAQGDQQMYQKTMEKIQLVQQYLNGKMR
jgi:tetratricopeptide (TPR) repeat protein